jgi:bifunctional UDP-N-acetylglucosamine pyrophosphorylase / glucosamine-1-phosphate N-acetyltransferase
MREVDRQARREASRQKVVRFAEQGLDMVDPSRIDVRGDLHFGSDVEIEVNVIFKGDVVLGNNVTIGANCIIEDSVLEDGVSVQDFTTVTGSHVGAASRLGPYARVRPGSRIGAACQIGNYVETKNVTMGEGCKINHHSFVGDATLGDRVIIGAGTITCNHDGKGNTATVIEDEAYVGSGVMLIAPIRIGRSSMIAAGSNITKDVPANTLAICRTKELVLKPARPR